MRIANNIMAMNAHRQLDEPKRRGQVHQALFGPADQPCRRRRCWFGHFREDAQPDPAKMAQKNAQDAISLIQTAGGRRSKRAAILQRMRELALRQPAAQHRYRPL